MKKFKSLIIIMFCLFSMGVFVACDNSANYKVEFNQESIEMQVGETLNLQDLVTLEVAQMKDVKFTSKNPSIVFVKTNNEITASQNGTAIIEAKTGNSIDNLTIVVTSPVEQFSSVTNLNFEDFTNKLVWNHSLKVKNGKNVRASEYILTITTQEEVTTQTTTSNFYEFTTAGSYTVSVVATAQGFLPSTAVEKSFNVLQTPQNLVYDKQTQMLSWTAINDAEYILSYNGFDTTVLTNSRTFGFEEVGEHKISVRAKIGNDYSKPSQQIVITRLTSPEVTIQNGILNFDLSEASLISKYEIRVQSNLGGEPTIVDNTTGTYGLDSFDAGTYNLSVKALAQSDNVLDSLNPDVHVITKLQAPSITFNKATKIATLSESGVSVVLINKVTGQLETVEIDQNNQYYLDKTQGLFEIYAYKPAVENNQVNSDNSNSINVKIIAPATQVSHQSNNDDSIILFRPTEGASSYKVLVDGVETQFVDQNAMENKSFLLNGKTSEVFADAKEYALTIEATDAEFENQGSNYYLILNDISDETLTITRFDAPTLNYENNIISWAEIDNAVGYEFELLKDLEIIVTNTITSLQFDTSNLEYGNYTFKIKTLGDQRNFLNSIIVSQHEFKIKGTLESPEFSFNSQTQELVVSHVENANQYAITVNGQFLVNLTDDLIFYVGDLFVDAGEYEFEVIASNTNDSADNDGLGNLYSSLPSTLIVEKLRVITQIEIEQENQLIISEIDLINQSILSSEKFELVVNDVVMTDNTQIVFSELETYVIKLKLISNKNLSYPYYVDGDYSVFTLTRFETITNIEYSDNILTWSNIVEAENYKLSFVVNNITYVYNTTTNSLDLQDLEGQAYYQEMMEEGFSVNIVAYVEAFTLNQDETANISSLESDSFVVEVLQMPEIEDIYFDSAIYQNEITVVWTSVSNATGYLVSINGIEQDILVNQVVFNQQESIYQYILTIMAYNSSYINSQTKVFTFNKVSEVVNVSINEGETLSVIGSPENTVGVLYNEQSVFENIYQLTPIVDNASIEVMYLGKGRDADEFYLNSAKVTFNFERLLPIQNLAINESMISWELDSSAEKYELIIENNLGATKSIIIDAKNAQGEYVYSMLLNNAELLDFTNESGIYNVYIRSIILPYQLTYPTKINGLLGSLLSDGVEFGKLEKVTDLSVWAENTTEQLAVTISWASVAYATSYDIFINNQFFANSLTNSYTTSLLVYDSPFAINGGDFNITVVALNSNYISSDASNPVYTKRLNPVQASSMLISTKGMFTWAAVLGNSGYSVYYKRQGETSSDVYDSSNVYYNFETLLHQDSFVGGIDFYVLAKGNRSTTLSSAYTFSTKLRLDIPVINFENSSLTISPSVLQPNASFTLIVKFNNGGNIQTILTTFLTANEIYNIPDYYTYQGQPLSSDVDYIFEAFASAQDCVDSPIASVIKQKLNSVEILGFTKLAGDEQQIALVADVGAMISNPSVYYTLSIMGSRFVTSAITPDINGLLTYILTDDFNNYLSNGNFTIAIKSQAPDYLDSISSVISGKRLNIVSRLDGANGLLNWERTNQVESTGYLLRVLHNSNQTTYFSKTNADYFDELTGISGSIVANVKVLGNLQVGNYTLNSVVIDSQYIVEYVVTMTDLLVTEKNLTTFKLAAPTEIGINYGDIKILSVLDATGYIAKDGTGRLFTLNTIDWEDGYSYGLSDEFYEGSKKLNLNQTYIFSVRAVSDEDNVLSSDFDGSLQIRILPNPNTQASNLVYSWSSASTDKFRLDWLESTISQYYIYTLKGSVVGEQFVSSVSLINYSFQNYEIFDADLIEPSGSYTFKVRVAGDNNLQAGGYYYLSSSYSPELTFTKLDVPEVSVVDGVVSWNNVQNANGYYIYYKVKTTDDNLILDDFIISYTQFSNMQTQLSWNMPENLGTLNQDVEYYIAVRAVNTNNALKFAPSMVGAIYEQIFVENQAPENTENMRALTKLQAPNELELIGGTLKWQGDYDYTINFFTGEFSVNGGSEPFTYTDNIETLIDLDIILRLTDTNNGTQRKYTVKAVDFFDAEILNLIRSLGLESQLGFELKTNLGWPTIEYFTNEIGPSIAPGLQHLSVLQKGNSYDWLDSMYTTGYSIYIPHKPVTRIADSVLSWDSITLPLGQRPYHAENKYTIVAENANGVRVVIAQTNELSVNLIDLINQDKLQSGNQKLYVFVTGDSVNYIHGLASNPIQIQVLPNVTASMSGGKLYWDSVSQAQSYNLIMDPNNTNYKYEQSVSFAPWDFSQISVKDALNQTLQYNLTMQAIGNGTTIISGKVTNLGTITKLETPQVSVVQGVFVWNNVASNFGYQAIVKNELQEIQEIPLTIDTVSYESNITGFNNYNFKAIGSTQLLSETSNAYAISSSSTNGINAVMLDSITMARPHQGNLLWSNIKELNNSDVEGYKISFDSENYYDPIFTTDFNKVNIESQTYVVYKIGAEYTSGIYKVYIQPYSNNSYYRASDGKTYQYLLGGIVEDESSAEFNKLRNVENITSQDGVIKWTKTDVFSDVYKVTFIRSAQVVEFMTYTNEFNPATLTGTDAIKYGTITAGQNYTVRVQTIGDDNDLINSDEIQSSYAYAKLSTIIDVSYSVDTSGDEGFVIRWNFSDYLSEITNYHYIIRYKNTPDGEYQTIDSRLSSEIRRGFDDVLDAYYGEIDGSSLLNELTEELLFSIAIVPMTTTPIITSDFSAERSVIPPSSLDGVFGFDENSRKISWVYQAGGDVSFRIVDELVTVDEFNEITVVSTKTYTSQVSEYYPEAIGLHRISISVMLRGEQVASSYVFFTYETAVNGIVNSPTFVLDNNGVDTTFSLVNFDLFAGGDGSSLTPYLISNQTQFMNMNYRLVKPSYMAGEATFNFKQTQNLTMTITSPITAFAGVYDGDFKLLTWNRTNTTNTKIGLFTTLEGIGVIKNVVISAKIVQYDEASISTINMSALVVDNYGLITNSQIKSFVFETPMLKAVDYYYGSFANINYGTISNSVNTAQILFDGNSTQLGVRNSKLFVGGIAYNNSNGTRAGITYNGLISQVGNTGLIKVVANAVSAGGIASNTSAASNITQAYNKGNLEITILSTGSTTNFVGGLVASNSGRIRNSYNAAALITANLSNVNRTINIGGLAGIINGASGAIISNSFTTTTAISATNASAANVRMAIMVGYSNALDTLLQTTSYYFAVSGLIAINNSPNGFNTALIGSYAALQTNLNNIDYCFANGATYPILIWEQSFVIR